MRSHPAVLAAVLGACGSGNNARVDPLALEGKPSDACSQAIMDGHNSEAAGKQAPFLASVRECGSLSAWIEAANLAAVVTFALSAVAGLVGGSLAVGRSLFWRSW